MAAGVKTGGRVKGTPNKATAHRQAKIQAEGITPLDYMLKTLRDEGRDHEERMQAATAAAPYVHPKLATTTLKGDETAPLIHKIRRAVIKPGAVRP
jgi:hypothetical protein